MLTKLKRYLIAITIFSMMIQTSFVSGLLKFEKAKAASADITKLVIITTQQQISPDTASAVMTFQTQNSSNEPETVSESNTFTISSNSSTGLFSLNGSTAWESTKNTSFSSGSTKNFYYKDSTPDTYTIAVTPPEGQMWTPATQNITITDTTSPIITLLGSTPVTVELGSTYTDAGATALDNIDGNITASIVTVNPVNTNVIGSYTVTYNVLDSSSNPATQVTRTVNVVDTTPPVSIISDLIGNNGSGYYNATNFPTSISGTATDASGIASVKLRIMTTILGTTYYWDQSALGWSVTETWNTTTGTTSWSWSATNLVSTLVDGATYTVNSRATDSSVNSNVETNLTDSSQKIFTYDITAPTGTVKINDNEGVTNSTSVNLTLTASSDTTLMQITGDITSSSESYVVYNSSPSYTLTDTKGLKTVKVKLKDAAGNISSEFSDSIYYNSNSTNPTETSITSGVETPASNVSELSATTTSTPATMTVSKYTQNPEGALPAGITTLGKFYDFSLTATPSSQVEVRIYYTAQDLLNAGITDENKLQGIYYWDFSAPTPSWKLFSTTGKDTSDIVFNTVSYAGYVYATINSNEFSLIAYTPITPGADITAPGKPANFTANSGDGQVSLIWDKVTDASSYSFRYRKSTSVDNTSYVIVNGLTSNSTTVTGLTNDTEYEFGVAAVDSAGNTSEYAVVNQTPHKTISSSTTTTTTTSTSNSSTSTTSTSKSSNFFGRAKAAESTASPTNEQQITTTPSDNGQVQSAETSNNESESVNWSRLLITLGILLLAVGAGFGGYYGYQWWIGGASDDEKKNENKTKDKNNDGNKDKGKGKGGRW